MEGRWSRCVGQRTGRREDRSVVRSRAPCEGLRSAGLRLTRPATTTFLRTCLRAASPAAAALVLVGSVGFAQYDTVSRESSQLARFDDWFRLYRDGRIVFGDVPGKVPAGSRADSLEGASEFQRALSACLSSPGRGATDRLLSLASFRFHPDPSVEAIRNAPQAPERVREAALRALVAVADPETLQFLAREILMERRRTPPEKRVAAARVLGERKDASTLLALYSATSDPDAGVRESAISAAIRVGGPKASRLLGWLSDPSAPIRGRVLDAVGSALADVEDANARTPLLDAVLARLGDDDWRIRDRAAEILGAHPSREAVPALIAALEAEHLRIGQGTGRKRLLHRFGETLATITGIDIPALDAGRWRVWWDAAGHRFRIGDEVTGRPRTRADGATYFSIPIRSDRMVFLVDVSGSMNDDYGAPPLTTGKQDPVIVQPASPGRWTKIERVKNELLRVIRGLEERDQFQIVAFSDEVSAAFPCLTAATRAHKKSAEKFVLGLRAGGGTGLYDALATSLPLDAACAASPAGEPDTLFVLSDGKPTVGRVTDPWEIARITTSANDTSRMEIHTLYLGPEGDGPAQFLVQLARRNGGIFRRIPEH